MLTSILSVKRESVLVETETVEGVVFVQAFFLYIGGSTSSGKDGSRLVGGYVLFLVGSSLGG